MEQALATFERSIVSAKAPFDRWIKGDETAINEAAKRGFDLFNGKANCAACHSGWVFTDASFHDIGVGQNDDIGRGRLFPNSVKLRYAFKTPTLRDVAHRGPYMHDGSVASLEAVIDLYQEGGIDRPSRAEEIHRLDLTERDKKDLIAFLETLTEKPKSIAMPILPRRSLSRLPSDFLCRRPAFAVRFCCKSVLGFMKAMLVYSVTATAANRPRGGFSVAVAEDRRGRRMPCDPEDVTKAAAGSSKNH